MLSFRNPLHPGADETIVAIRAVCLPAERPKSCGATGRVEITYSDPDCTSDGRTKTYAHYRVFEAFRCVAGDVQRVDVSMARERRAGSGHKVTCTVRAELRNGGRVAATATGDWPYAAIQRAAIQARQKLDSNVEPCHP
jgi:hypothetical protein